MPNYQNGKIYKVLNHIDCEVYVGSTCGSLALRLSRHRSMAKCGGKGLVYQHMRQLGQQNFFIELVEDCPCDNKEQLFKREGECIRELGTLNKNIAGRACGNCTYYEANKEAYKERCKAYYEKNKERVHLQQKLYYHSNKDNARAYREKNRERIREYRAKYYKTHGK